jgi:hypothetical protein
VWRKLSPRLEPFIQEKANSRELFWVPHPCGPEQGWDDVDQSYQHSSNRGEFNPAAAYSAAPSAAAACPQIHQ